MKKIDLTEYMVDVDLPPEMGGTKSIPYDVKKSLAGILFHQDNRLTARELLENDLVARKILSSNGSVLLEDSEYQRVRLAIESGRGYTRQDVELVKRVLDAPEIKVKEAS